MNCDMVVQQINAWLDKQLEPTQQQAVSTHLHECLNCRQVMFERYTIITLRAKTERIPAPSALKNHVVEQIDSIPLPILFWKKFTSLFKLGPVPIVVASACLVLMFYFFSPMLRSQPEVVSDWWVAQAALSCHEQNTALLTGYDYTDAEPAILEKKLNSAQKRDFPVALPSIDTSTFAIRGCRFCELGEKPSVFLAMHREGHDISLEIVNAKDITLPKAKTYEIEGVRYLKATGNNHNILIWKNADLLYVMTSDLPENKLTAIFHGSTMAGKSHTHGDMI
jgi:hypothetical protein